MTTVTIGDKQVAIRERDTTADIVESVNKYLAAVEALKQSKRAQQVRQNIIIFSGGAICGAIVSIATVTR